MTPDDVLTRMIAKYPLSFNDQRKVDIWREDYLSGLAKLSPERLKAAYEKALTVWDKASPFPVALLVESAPPAADAAASPTRDPSLPRSDAEIDRIMQSIVITQLGRLFVTEGCAWDLEDLIRDRKIHDFANLSENLLEQRKRIRRDFEAARALIDPQKFTAKSLYAIHDKQRERVAAATAKWTAYLEKQGGAA